MGPNTNTNPNANSNPHPYFEPDTTGKPNPKSLTLPITSTDTHCSISPHFIHLQGRSHDFILTEAKGQRWWGRMVGKGARGERSSVSLQWLVGALVWPPCAEYHLSPKTRTTLRIICRKPQR